MKRLKDNIMLIIIGVIVLIPVAYYFCYALPQHNIAMQEIEKEKLEQEREKLEHEKEQDRLKQKEKEDKQREKEANQRKFNECINEAEIWKNDIVKTYVELSYKQCKDQIDSINRNNSPLYQYDYSECEKFKIDKDGRWTMTTALAEQREKEYNKKIELCQQYRW